MPLLRYAQQGSTKYIVHLGSQLLETSLGPTLDIL